MANLKSDIKLLKTDVKSLLDEPIFSISVTSLDECINKVSAFDKRLNRLAKRIQGEPAQATATPSKAATGTVSTEHPLCVPGKQPSQSVTVSVPGLRDQPSQAVTVTGPGLCTPSPQTAVVSEPRLSGQPSQSVAVAGLEMSKQPSQSVTMSEAGLSKQPSQSATLHESGLNRQMYNTVHVNKSGESALVRAKHSNVFSRIPLDIVSESRENLNETVPCKSYSSVVSSKQREQSARSKVTCMPSAADGSQSSSNTASNNNLFQDILNNGRRELNRSLINSHNSDMHFQNRIPVLVSGSQNTDSSSKCTTQVCVDDSTSISLEDDIDFSSFIRKRTKRYYIGGFKPSITQEKIISYVESKGLTVTWVNIWISNTTGRVIIRLNVEATEGFYKIAEPGFWPKGVKCRPWVTKSRYNASLKRSGQEHRNIDLEYDASDDQGHVNDSHGYHGYEDYNQYNVIGEYY